jgi:hypothetical protein
MRAGTEGGSGVRRDVWFAGLVDAEGVGYGITNLVQYPAMEYPDWALEFVVLNCLKPLDVGVTTLA